MMPTRRDAALALLAYAAAGVAAPRAWGGLPAGQAASAPDAGSPVAETPVTLGRDRHDHLTAPVTLNGQGPFAFIVDTGASISCVSADLVEALGLPMATARRVHTIVGVRTLPVALVDELRIGVRRQRRMAALSIKLEQPEIQGVLAVDWLKGQRVMLDFVSSSIQFEVSRDERSEPGRVVVPARRRHGQLTMVDAELGERRVNAMIDSGSEMSVCNTALLRLLDRAEAIPARRQIVEMVTVIGEPFEGELVYLPFLRLGGLLLGNVGVMHADTHVFELWGLADKPTVLLGMDLLGEFQAVSLDFGRSQVRFDLRPN